MPTNLKDPAVLGGLVAKALSGGAADDLAGAWTRTRDALRDAVREDPVDAAFATAFCGAYLFFLAERGKNPKVKTFGDALVFISTCMSVGYSDIFARTEAGKYIASTVMTVGPSMVAQLLAPTAGEQRDDGARAEARHRELLAAVGAVAEALQRRR